MIVCVIEREHYYGSLHFCFWFYPGLDRIVPGWLPLNFKFLLEQGLILFFILAEEVLLDNVELILEAFDYLQLPFALKQGNAI